MNGSKEIMAAAIRLAVTSSIEEEKLLARTLREQGVSAAAVNFGGEYISSVGKIIERTIVAATVSYTHLDVYKRQRLD